MIHTMHALLRKILTFSMLVVFTANLIPQFYNQVENITVLDSPCFSDLLSQRSTADLHFSVPEKSLSIVNVISSERFTDSTSRVQIRHLSLYLYITKISLILIILILIKQLLLNSSCTYLFSVICYQHLSDGEKPSHNYVFRKREILSQI